MSVRVAINGFGRIGRNVLRAIAEADRGDIEVVAINDLAPVETNAHLLRFDSVHGRFPREVKVVGDSISVGNGMQIGLIPYDTPSVEGIQRYIKAETEKWGTLVRQLGLEGSQ